MSTTSAGKAVGPEVRGTYDPRNPSDFTYHAKGDPQSASIADLVRDPGGAAIAKSKWVWEPDYKHGNPGPVAVEMVDGKMRLLDGYHRVEQALRDGKTQISVQVKERRTAASPTDWPLNMRRKK